MARYVLGLAAARGPDGLELCQKAPGTTLPDFQYVPVISDALPENGWQGRSGYVHAAVMQDIPDLIRLPGVRLRRADHGRVRGRRDYVAQCGLPAG